MILQINHREKTVKNTNTWRLNRALLNNQEVTEEIKEELKKYTETSDNENMMTQNLWDTAKAVLREVYSNLVSRQETRKSQIHNLTLHLKQLEKGEQQQQQKNPKILEEKKS